MHSTYPVHLLDHPNNIWQTVQITKLIKKKVPFVGFKVLMAVNMKMTVFWDVVPLRSKANFYKTIQ
jgi:hypothetical protein